VFHISHSAGMRTSLRQQLHSLPPSHRSPYLEGHMLAKQKERLEKELCQLEHRCHQWRLRLADIAAKLEALSERQLSAAASPAPGGTGPTAHVASMTIEY
jgi:hypothetical protein